MLCTKHSKMIWLAAVLLAVSATSVWPAGPGGDPTLGKLPAGSVADFAQLAPTLLQPDAIAKLIKQYEAGGDVSKVEYAVHGLAMYSGRPGADADKKIFVTAVVADLAKVKPETRGFLIRELQTARGTDAAAAIGAFLLETENSEYAAQAEVAFGNDAAVEAVRTALPKAEGKMRVTLAQAAGNLRDAKAVALLTPLAKSEDRDLRMAAIAALGNIGDAGSADLLLKAVTSTSSYEGQAALDAVVKLGLSCEAAKDTATADKIYAALWALPEEQRAARCAGLQGLARVEGDKAMPAVNAAMASEDLEIRVVAIQAAGMMPGEKATQYWWGKLAAAKGDGKVEIVSLLGRRGEATALPAVTELLKSPDQAVRLVAIGAVAGIGKDKSIATLLPLMSSGDAEKQAVIQALGTLPGAGSGTSIAAALPTAEPGLKVVLLAVLSQRGTKEQIPAAAACLTDKDANVRIAALGTLQVLGDDTTVPARLQIALRGATEDERKAAEKSVIATLKRSADDETRIAPIVAALKTASGEDKAVLARILGQLGGKPAMDALLLLAKDAGAETKDAAIHALASSTSPLAEAPLLDLAKSAPNETLQILCLRGYIRLIGADAALTPAQKTVDYKSAMALANRPEEKRLVLAGLSGAPTPEGFELAAAALGDEAVRTEATSAILAIGQKVPGSPAMADAAKKIIAFTTDNNVKKQAENLQRKAGQK